MQPGSIASPTVQFPPGVGQSHGHGHHRPPRLPGTAELLGMTEKELAVARHSGTTLVDLAQAKGITKDDLVKSIVADLRTRPHRGPERTDEQLTQIATNIAEGTRPGRAHHGRKPGRDDDDPPPPAGTAPTSPFTAVASALGMKETDLLTALEGGATLPDIAEEHGSSIPALVDLLGKSTGTAIDTVA